MREAVDSGNRVCDAASCKLYWVWITVQKWGCVHMYVYHLIVGFFLLWFYVCTVFQGVCEFAFPHNSQDIHCVT